jgi:hypothetical protein
MIGSRRDCFVVVEGSPMRALILVSGLLAMSGLCGCQGEWGERGVPEEVRGVYALGDLYRLKKPVFLHRTDDMTGYRFLFAPTSDPPGSLTVDEYRAAPTKWRDIAGVVDAGTLIRITRFRLFELPWAALEVVFCDIVSGDMQQHDVEIFSAPFRRSGPDTDYLEPDPAYLDRVLQPATAESGS